MGKRFSYGFWECLTPLYPPPPMFKSGLICPVYKGGGRDPTLTTNYHGITINSVLSKLLEILILHRMEASLAEAGFPHRNQSAFRKHVGCADAIFASQELIARYLNEGSTVHMCLLDLQKAFDSVEFPVLLNRLFQFGINGKIWRLIKDWYGRWDLLRVCRWSLISCVPY